MRENVVQAQLSRRTFMQKVKALLHSVTGLMSQVADMLSIASTHVAHTMKQQ